MTDRINGKIVVITGTSSGLGEAAARHLAACGASVVLGARRTDRLDTLVAEIVAAGGQALAVQTDVTDRAAVANLVDTAVQRFGRIDVLINNAGIMPLSALESLKVDEWDRMIDVNIRGVLYGIAAALPHMKAQKSGQVITTSSVAGHVVFRASAVYSGTKFAVRAICEWLPSGSEGLQYPYHHPVPRRREDRVARADIGPERPCREQRFCRLGRHLRRQLCQDGGVCDQSAR